MKTEELKPIIDALIFISDEPLSEQRIQKIFEEASGDKLSLKEIRSVIDLLNLDNRDQGRGFFLQHVAGGYQYRTRPAYAQWIRKLYKTKPMRLTQSTLETLAIAAYRQPITKAEIEQVRGVDSGGVIKTLLERNLLKIAGRKNVAGKPFLFGTTKKFMEVFGLEKLSDLPSLSDIDEIDDSNLPEVFRERFEEEIIVDDDCKTESRLLENTESEGVDKGQDGAGLSGEDESYVLEEKDENSSEKE